MLLDRRNECAELDRLVAALRTGQSRAVVLWGDIGIGKTALLNYAREQAVGCRVIRASGVEAERELAFAALHQVCAPMSGELELLPAPQRGALRTAFGLDVGSPPDRFMVGLAVLGLLAEVAQVRPVVLLIDDAQWLDTASAQVIGFAARRLGTESVGLIFGARRTGAEISVPELAGLPEMHVRGLPDDDARALLALAHPGPVDDRVLDRIVAECQGNPLALLELPRGFTPAELAGGFGLLGTTALPRRIEESFRRQIATLSTTMRQVLLVAAAEPVGDPVLLWRAVDDLGLAADTDLASEEKAAGFVEFGSRVTFRHPLLRSAIYHTATPEDRRRVHGALAEVTDPIVDPDRRAWHRAQAAAGPDEDVAAELERSAGRAQARGGPAAAAAFLERASELTPVHERSGQRALAAAEAKQQAGMTDASLRLLAFADARLISKFDRARADLLRGRIAFSMNRGGETPAVLLKAAIELAPLDVRMARDTYLEAIRAGWFAAQLAGGATLRQIAEAARAAPAPVEAVGAADLLLDGLAVRYTDGYPSGAPILKKALSVFRDRDMSADEELRWIWFAVTTAAADLLDDEAWDALATRFVQLARDCGALAMLPMALTIQIIFQILAGDLAAAGALLAEQMAVAEGTDVHEPAYAARLLAAWRGDEDMAAKLIPATTAQVEQHGEGIGVISGAWMEGVLFNGLGQYEAAFVTADRGVKSWQEPAITTALALVELVTAASRTGRRAVAADALQRLADISEASGTDWALGLHARCAALVSDADVAEPHFQEAIDRLSRTRIRGEVARTHLLYGAWLRQQDRRNDAHDPLRTAHTMFTTMGMNGFADRAAEELAAIGETTRKRSDESAGQLTAQETQIVRLVREGLSNQEIAVRLFISRRTVEWHLSKIFAKLEITSRRQLHR
jgi:DNA-binding CsgD family transcriptional regulator/tetratricopeptide (TPR) repeat protein